jgi:WD40 repeat protein
MWSIFAILGVLTMHPSEARAADMSAEKSASVTLREIRTVIFPEVITTIAFSPDGTRLAASNGRDNQVYLYDLPHDRLLWKVGKAGPRPSTSLTFDSSGQTVITPSTMNWGLEHTDSVISLIDVDSGEVTKNITDVLDDGTVGTGRAECFSLSPDKHMIALVQATIPNRIVVYALDSWKAVGHIMLKTIGVRRMVYSANHVITTGYVDGKIETWDYVSNRLIASFKALNSDLQDMALNPATGTVIVGGDGAVLTRRIAPGDSPGSFETLSDDPSALVSEWDPLTGKRVMVYPGPGVAAFGVAVSPDGKYVAATKGEVAGKGSYLLIWQVGSGNLVGQIHYPRAIAYGVTFSEDGHTLAAAVDNTIRLVTMQN